MNKARELILVGLASLTLAGHIRAEAFSPSEVGVKFNPGYTPVMASSLNDVLSDHRALHIGISGLGSFAFCATLDKFGVPLEYALPGGAMLALGLGGIKELFDTPGNWKDMGYNAVGVATGAGAYLLVHEIGQLIQSPKQR